MKMATSPTSMLAMRELEMLDEISSSMRVRRSTETTPIKQRVTTGAEPKGTVRSSHSRDLTPTLSFAFARKSAPQMDSSTMTETSTQRTTTAATKVRDTSAEQRDALEQEGSNEYYHYKFLYDDGQKQSGEPAEPNLENLNSAASIVSHASATSASSIVSRYRRASAMSHDLRKRDIAASTENSCRLVSRRRSISKQEAPTGLFFSSGETAGQDACSIADMVLESPSCEKRPHARGNQLEDWSTADPICGDLEESDMSLPSSDDEAVLGPGPKEKRMPQRKPGKSLIARTTDSGPTGELPVGNAASESNAESRGLTTNNIAARSSAPSNSNLFGGSYRGSNSNNSSRGSAHATPTSTKERPSAHVTPRDDCSRSSSKNSTGDGSKPSAHATPRDDCSRSSSKNSTGDGSNSVTARLDQQRANCKLKMLHYYVNNNPRDKTLRRSVEQYNKLMKRGKHLSGELEQQLITHVLQGNTDWVANLLIKTPHGQGVLHSQWGGGLAKTSVLYAANRGDIDMIRLLLKYGGNTKALMEVKDLKNRNVQYYVEDKMGHCLADLLCGDSGMGHFSGRSSANAGGAARTMLAAAKTVGDSSNASTRTPSKENANGSASGSRTTSKESAK